MLQAVTVLVLVATTLAAPTQQSLFERQGRSYPQPLARGPQPLQQWVNTYNQAKAAGKIPTFAPALMGSDGNPYYQGIDPGPNGACSWTVAHCFNENGDGNFDVEDAPDGHIGISFDDGPTPASPQLYKFLQSKNLAATHFFIGSNIINNPDIFDQAVASGGHIAVHTWSHPYMTTMTDMQVLGELGWTAQAIYDKTGLVPRFWRPPYGDVDNRVRAIAKEVFGMDHTVIWNHDTNDWCLNDSGGSSCSGSGTPANDADLDTELQGFYSLPKSPGLIILEHELSSRTIGGFIRNYPTLISKGWIPQSIPDLWGAPWYLNADGPNDTPVPGYTIGGGDLAPVNNHAVNNNSTSSTATSTSSTSTSVAAEITTTTTPFSTTTTTSSFTTTTTATTATTTTTLMSTTTTTTTSTTAPTSAAQSASSTATAVFATSSPVVRNGAATTSASLTSLLVGLAAAIKLLA